MKEFKKIKVLGTNSFGETILVKVLDEKHRKETRELAEGLKNMISNELDVLAS